MSEYRVIGVEGLPEIGEGDDLGALIAAAVELEDGDVVVVAQKVVSKAEGRVRSLDGVEPSRYAREISGDRDPRQTEVILGETARIVRLRPPLLIAQTRHGFVCASAGVDASNAPRTGHRRPPSRGPRCVGRAHPRPARGADRPAPRRPRHRLVRPRLARGDDRRRARRRRPPGPQEPARRARSGRLRAARDHDRRRRRDRGRGRARDGEALARPRGRRARAACHR